MTNTLYIFASLTLAEPFQDIIHGFTRIHPDLSVKLTYAFCGVPAESDLAHAFVAYLQTDSAQKILKFTGFAPALSAQPLPNAF